MTGRHSGLSDMKLSHCIFQGKELRQTMNISISGHECLDGA